MINIFINPNNKIKYLKCSNLVLNIVFHSYLFLIRNRLYTFGKSKVINHRTLVNLSLNLMMNGRG